MKDVITADDIRTYLGERFHDQNDERGWAAFAAICDSNILKGKRPVMPDEFVFELTVNGAPAHFSDLVKRMWKGAKEAALKEAHEEVAKKFHDAASQLQELVDDADRALRESLGIHQDDDDY